jgi:drug/metabolite transporter (DMT)-like permease
MASGAPAQINSNKAHWLALAALFAGASAVAASPLFVRWSETGPTPAAFWRAALALPALWLWSLLERAPRRTHAPTATLRASIGLAGFFFAGDLIFWHGSIMNTSVANATFLATCAPIFVVPVAWLIFKARTGALFLAGMACALLGVLLLIGPNLRAREAALAGDLMGLVTAMFFASYLLAVSRARIYLSTARIMAWSTSITALCILPVALLSGETFLPSSARGWWTLIGLALLPQVVGQSLIAYALAHLPAAFSSVGLLLEPVVAALLAWLLLKEGMSPVQLAGSAAVLLGIFLAHRGSREQSSQAT